MSGHPIELVYWVHDAKVVKPNERIKMSEDGLRLHIKNSQKEDQGVYQCFVSNTKDQAYGVSEYLIDGKSISISNLKSHVQYTIL